MSTNHQPIGRIGGYHAMTACVPCTTCGAPTEVYCETAAGTPMRSVHQARRRAFRDYVNGTDQGTEDATMRGLALMVNLQRALERVQDHIYSGHACPGCGVSWDGHALDHLDNCVYIGILDAYAAADDAEVYAEYPTEAPVQAELITAMTILDLPLPSELPGWMDDYPEQAADEGHMAAAEAAGWHPWSTDQVDGWLRS